LCFSKYGFKTVGTDLSSVYRKAVQQYFRPEFINRIDRIVIFKSLEFAHILDIAKLQINELLERDGFVRRTTILNVEPSALEWVAKRGFHEKMGGRALKRQIERDLTALSADQLINSNNDHPIIFEITLENDHLKPQIIALEFAMPRSKKWIPEIPEEKEGKKFLKKLQRRVWKLEQQIENEEFQFGIEKSESVKLEQEIAEGENWEYFDFKRRVGEAKENLNNLLLGYGSRYAIKAPQIPFRLKRGQYGTDYDERNYRRSIQDYLFQKEAFLELHENYTFSLELFNKDRSELLNRYLEISLLEIFSKGFIRDKKKKISIIIKSGIIGKGQDACQYLLDLYCQFFESEEIHYSVDKKLKTIHLEGQELSNLMKGEAGIHLFFDSNRNALPIRISLERPGKKKTEKQNNTIVRIYNPNFITDLRTGLNNPLNISEQELKLLILAGAGGH